MDFSQVCNIPIWWWKYILTRWILLHISWALRGSASPGRFKANCNTNIFHLGEGGTCTFELDLKGKGRGEVGRWRHGAIAVSYGIFTPVIGSKNCPSPTFRHQLNLQSYLYFKFKCLTNLVPLSLCMLYIGISCNILLIKLRAARNIVWLPPTKFEWSYQRHIFVQRAYHAAIQSFKGIFLLWSMPSKVVKSIVKLTSSQGSIDAIAYRWQIWKCHSLTDPYGANN